MPDFVITADSVPILDSWGWSDYWQCSDWIKWFNLKKKNTGQKKQRKILTIIGTSKTEQPALIIGVNTTMNLQSFQKKKD